MKKVLNSINNDQLIKIGDNWIFSFLEEDYFQSSPVTPHHLTCHDLSINISLQLKWALYGWFYFKSISETLDDEDFLDDLYFPDAINPDFETVKYKKVLLFNGVETGSIDLFKNKLENAPYKTFSNENDLVSFKLKLNVNEFIAIQSTLFPVISELI
jgi:hypothetical protein